MLKRTIVIESACHLSLRHGQLIYRARGDDAEDVLIPMEDIGVVLFDHAAITLSARALAKLNEQGAAVIFCDDTHHPAALLQPLDRNNTHAEVLRSQMKLSQPGAKRIWQQIVKRKILNQAALLAALGAGGVDAMKKHAGSVKSGDSDNREGQAARVYWANLFNRRDFKREREGEPPNNYLNYGYAVLRAACARALVSSGLYCAIGLHHRNRYNAFALADDFMEPYRPFIDSAVVSLMEQGADGGMNREVKQALLAVLITDTYFPDKKRPLMNALTLSSASLVRCIAGQEKSVLYPEMS